MREVPLRAFFVLQQKSVDFRKSIFKQITVLMNALFFGLTTLDIQYLIPTHPQPNSKTKRKMPVWKSVDPPLMPLLPMRT